jgi:hippurate hydrolase
MAAPRPDTVPAHLAAHMVALRRDLHQHPELSWQERRTHDVICRELDALGIEHRRNVAGTGVIADIPGPAGVPAVALRADTDALAIHEETGLPFASQTAGVMHACGHDGHTSMLLGAAALLAGRTDLPAPVRLLWQPAEEKVDGARALIAEGALEGVGCIFAGHVDRHYPAGTLAVTRGAVNASTDRFHIVLRGQDAHGARPHEAVDAIVIGALLVMSIQTIVSREVDPAHPSVVTVGRFQAGTVHNAIAGVAELEGTIRAQHPAVRAHLKRSVERMATAVADLHGARAEVTIEPGAPPVINDDGAWAHAHAAAAAVVGPDRVVPLKTANMGGEDFADYLEHVPGCYIRFGAQVPGRESFPAHSSRFDFDESAMAIGAAWFVRVAEIAGAAMAGRG